MTISYQHTLYLECGLMQGCHFVFLLWICCLNKNTTGETLAMDFVDVCSVIPTGFGDLLLCDLAEGTHLPWESHLRSNGMSSLRFVKTELLLEIDVFLFVCWVGWLAGWLVLLFFFPTCSFYQRFIDVCFVKTFGCFFLGPTTRQTTSRKLTRLLGFPQNSCK